VAVYSLLNCKVLVGGYDISGESNKAILKEDVKELDVTGFGSTFVNRIGGLFDIDCQIDGFLDLAANQTEQVFDLIYPPGTNGVVTTLGPVDGNVGSPCELFQSLQCSRQIPTTVGDAAKFSVDLKGTQTRRAAGLFVANGTFTTTTSTTGQQVGAVGANQHLYAAANILAVSGTTPTCTITIQSSTTQAGSYTTRGTFAASNTVGGYWLTPVAGPFTDTWWRATLTIGGTTPSFTAIVGVAVGP